MAEFSETNSFQVGQIFKLKKKATNAYKTLNAVRSGEFPYILEHLNRIETLLLNAPVNNDPKRLIRLSKELRKRASYYVLQLISHFNPITLKLHWEELDFVQQKRFIIELEVDNDNSSTKVTKINEYLSIHDKKKKKEDFDNVIDYIFQTGVFTPLIIEENPKKEPVINKYFLDFLGKGELFNYDKKITKNYPIRTLFFPIELNGEIISILEILFKEKEDVNLFANSFLRFLRDIHKKLVNNIFAIKASGGLNVYRKLLKDQPLYKSDYVTKGVVFFDIAGYSKLSLQIKDKELNDAENEQLKVEVLSTFHYVASEVISQFSHYEIDKLMGDLVMLILDEDHTIDNEDERFQELAQRGFIITWNIQIALRTINNRIKEMIEDKGLNILNEETHRKISEQLANKQLKINLVTYTERKRDQRDIELSIPFELILRYYYILKKYNVDHGLEVRTGFNIGKVLKVNLGSLFIDSTVIGKEVDLASRMENLGRKNVIKMPMKVFKALSEPFKNFVVNYIAKENGLENQALTYKMVFQGKRENPKGSKPIGTVEFNADLGNLYRLAQKHFSQLDKLFEQYSPNDVNLKMEKYIKANMDRIVQSTRSANPDLRDQSDDVIVKLIKKNPGFQTKVRNHVINEIDQSVNQYLESFKKEKEITRLVRNLVLNTSTDHFKKFFTDKSRMSESSKVKFFQEKLFDKMRPNIDFKLLTRADIENMITDIYNKIYGKASD